MATNKNIQMSEFNGVDYDILLPQTRLDSELGNEYLWHYITKEVKYEFGTPNPSGTIVQSSSPESYVTLYYGDTIGIDDKLVNPQSITVSYNTYENANVLKGKIYQVASVNAFMHVPADAPDATREEFVANGITQYKVSMPNGWVKTTIVDKYTYVNSTDSNTYPPSVSDGNDYIFDGKLGDKSKITIVSYKGNASSNAFTRRIDIGMPFKIIILFSSHQTDWSFSNLWFLSELSFYYSSQTTEQIVIDSDKKGFTISKTSSVYGSQWNTSGVTYNCIVIS